MNKEKKKEKGLAQRRENHIGGDKLIGETWRRVGFVVRGRSLLGSWEMRCAGIERGRSAS